MYVVGKGSPMRPVSPFQLYMEVLTEKSKKTKDCKKQSNKRIL
jgi:hypothetical protein